MKWSSVCVQSWRALLNPLSWAHLEKEHIQKPTPTGFHWPSPWKQMEWVNPSAFCCGEPVSQTLAVGAELGGTSAWVTRKLTRASDLEEDSLYLMAFWEFTVTLLTQRAQSFYWYPLHLSRSPSHTVLDPAGCILFIFHTFYAPPSLCSSHFVLFFGLLASHFISLSCLTDCADCCPGVGGWSNRHTLAVCPSPQRLSCQRRRWRISVLQDYCAFCHCKCHSRRSASHYSLRMRVWDLLRDVKEVFHHINHPGFCLHAWQPRLDV